MDILLSGMLFDITFEWFYVTKWLFNTGEDNRNSLLELNEGQQQPLNRGQTTVKEVIFGTADCLTESGCLIWCHGLYITFHRIVYYHIHVLKQPCVGVVYENCWETRERWNAGQECSLYLRIWAGAHHQDFLNFFKCSALYKKVSFDRLELLHMYMRI